MDPAVPTLSPSALNRFLGCEYRTCLDLLERRGELDAERRPPKMEHLFERGMRHEDAVIEGLKSEGREVVSLDDPDATPEERAARTIATMQKGREILHQGCFANGDWVGYPDFLVRVDKASKLGEWSYEVHDAKLSTTAKPAHIFQLLFYTDELERLQGVRPERMHLMLGDGTRPTFGPEDFDAYAQVIRQQFLERYGELAGGAEPVYPYPVSACDFCHWWHVCSDRRRADDHLSLVANLQRAQGLKLERAGVLTMGALASLPADVVVPRLTQETVGNLRAQADLQVRSRGLERPLYELLEPEHDRGLGRLPAPSAGDVHFDFEGDPNWGDEGLEYLFGTLYEEDGEQRYWPLWATTRSGEKHALEQWIDWLMARLETHPDLHVFHYNAYEPTVLKRLVARHATRELELDQLLERRVFVDLYGITRQAVRAGVERYGLKAMEAVYGFQRSAEIDAVGSLRRWQQHLDDGAQRWLDEIAIYNEDDCRSTLALYGWLRERRPEAEAKFGITLAELAPEPPKPPSSRALQLQQRTEALRPKLLAELPDDESQDTEEQRARRLAFTLTGYHGREAKPQWWAFFERREKTIEQLRDEDSEAISGLTVVSTEDLGRSWQWTCTYEAQDHKMAPGGADDPIAEKGATIVSLDDSARTVVVKRGKQQGADAPVALAPTGPYGVDAQVDAVFAFAERIADGGLNRAEAALDLLVRRPPRFAPGTPSLEPGAVKLDRLAEQIRGLDRSALMIQGPPGTGKTYTGARVALRLMEAGLRVGVMATSHKAINNLLGAIDAAADDAGCDFRGWRKSASSGGDDNYSSARITCSGRPDEAEGRLDLHAGTAWWWAHPDVAESVDVLFIDEAGQVSLADAIAVAQGARSVVLLGDPQQLAHVSQGTHAIGSGASVLEHLIGDAQTVAADRGVFLDVSWRMHPDVCDFASLSMYDGHLTAEASCARQRIDSPRGLSGTGLRMIGIEHEDNRGRSLEEAEAIAREIELLLDGGTFVDRDGKRRPLTLQDILVVAPYNAQVRCLRAKLPAGARVGTVDKFQGQEAPIVFFSMASSTGDDVSRGMSFLFSAKRLNVALSRAQALAMVVCSPALLRARCSTVEDMRLVNLLCRVAERAETVAAVPR